jgi:hypothetical protein
MIRYRCSHCAALIVAHERRAGQSSVCKACLKPHQIPADKALWLNESGEPPCVSATPAATPAEPPASASPAAQAPTVPELELPNPIPVEPAPPPVAAREPELAPAAPVRAARAPEPPSAPVEEEAEQPEPVATATATPPPAASTPSTPPPRGAGRFAPVPVTPAAVEPVEPAEAARAEPVQLQTQADIAVALTTALSTRMKPPAAPRRDLRLSTAAWMLLTGIGLALVILIVFRGTPYFWPALAVGIVQIVCGYVWIVRLTYLRDPKRGLQCAIPPLTFQYLVEYKYAKLRPLRFVATGAVLCLLAAVAPALHERTRGLVSRPEPAPVVPPDPATQSKLEQLRIYRERQAYDPLMKVLEVLAKTDPLISEDAKDRAALAAELKGLCQHTDIGVRVRAMAAYARWDPNGARAVCLAAVRSATPEEREEALKLLPQWKDAESARAVQSLIGRPGTVETNRAKAALEEIGGPPAEQAAVALLNRSSDQATKLTALDILEKVGGAEIAASLRSYAMAADDPAVRARALAAADAIDARVRPPAP